MMRVAFDLNPVLVNSYSGFYSYGTGLLKGLMQTCVDCEILLIYSQKYHSEAKKVKSQFIPKAELRPLAVKMRWLESYWNLFNVPGLQTFTGNFDIYHCVHHTMPPTKNKKRVMTVHDLRRYALPNLYTKSKLQRFEAAVRKADHFIAVSQSTKDDLCKYLSVSPAKVEVIPLAANEDLRPFSEYKKESVRQVLSKNVGIPLKRFLLSFSSPDRRKNITRTIGAFCSAKNYLTEDYKLVVIGNAPKNNPEFEAAIKDKGIIFTGPVENAADWLACADGLVFASLYEGFGMPIIEAFRAGTPVITSNISSMPEVAGDAALLVEPENKDSIATAILKLCMESDLRQDLIRAGLKRAEEFCWTKTAQKTYNLYRNLVLA